MARLMDLHKDSSELIDRFNEFGITISQAAHMSGLSRNTIYNILQGKPVKETTVSKFKIALSHAGFSLDISNEMRGVLDFPKQKRVNPLGQTEHIEQITKNCSDANIATRKLFDLLDELNASLTENTIPSDIKDFKSLMREIRKVSHLIAELEGHNLEMSKPCY